MVCCVNYCLLSIILQLSDVDTVFCSPSICMLEPENSKNIIFSPWGHRRIYIDVGQPVRASQHSNCLFQSNRPKCPWLTLGRLKVKVSQNHPKKKKTFFMFLHQTRATWPFSSTLTKFNPRLTLKGTRNPNFDLTIRTGWDQRHCEDQQIRFPTTIHWLKLELKRIRYLENRENCFSTLLKAINADPTIGFSISLVFRKLKIQRFPGTPRLA